MEQAFWSPGGFGLRRFRRTLGGSIEAAEWAAPRLDLPAGDWLEIGVGPVGIGCAHFLGPGGELHTIDPIGPTAVDDWRMLPEPCKALVRACQETEVRHIGQAERLEFPDDKFVFVASKNMLDHVEDPDAVLKEVRRVLKPGGRFLLIVDTFSLLGEARFRLFTQRRERDTMLVGSHPHQFSREGVERLLGETGFRIVHAEGAGSFATLVGHSYRMSVIAA
jgi:SAM-dependent methyltransferase